MIGTTVLLAWWGPEGKSFRPILNLCICCLFSRVDFKFEWSWAFFFIRPPLVLNHQLTCVGQPAKGPRGHRGCWCLGKKAFFDYINYIISYLRFCIPFYYLCSFSIVFFWLHCFSDGPPKLVMSFVLPSVDGSEAALEEGNTHLSCLLYPQNQGRQTTEEDRQRIWIHPQMLSIWLLSI